MLIVDLNCCRLFRSHKLKGGAAAAVTVVEIESLVG